MTTAAASSPAAARPAGHLPVEALLAQGIDTGFGVPGESHLAVLDGLHEHRGRIRFVACRREGGAAFMAGAQGKLTGRPGTCFVTRGPGTTNAAIGVHSALQDSTPMILFVGQVASGARDREAFQEMATATGCAAGKLLSLVVDNGSYGTIRMHQEREYPGRMSGSGLSNPDFVMLARAYGRHAKLVEHTAQFEPALGCPGLLHLKLDRDVSTGRTTLAAIREAALERAAPTQRRTHG